MQELQAAQTMLKETINSQVKQLVETSENVANEYLAQRKTARENTLVNQKVIGDLDNQIRTLQGLQKSGLMDGKMDKDVEQYLRQYKMVRQELVQSNAEYIEKINKQNQDEQQNMDAIPTKKKNEVEEPIQSINSDFSVNQLIDSEASPMLPTTLKRAKCIRKWALRILEGTNFGILLIFILFLIFRFIVS